MNKRPSPKRPTHPVTAKTKNAGSKRSSGLDAKAFLENALQQLENGPVDRKGVTAYSDAANDEPDAPVVFTGESELQMRRIIDKLSLERMPFTVAEYQGVLEYLDWFQDASGEKLTAYTKAPHLMVGHHKGAVNFARKHFPHWAKPMELYVQNKMEELKAYHAKHRFVEYLGAYWVWSEKRDEDIRAKRPVDDAPGPSPFDG